MFPNYHFISGFLNISPVHSKTKNALAKKETQSLILTRKYTLSINIVDAHISAYASCVFSLTCQVLVLTIVTVLQFWQMRYKMLARPINLSL